MVSEWEMVMQSIRITIPMPKASAYLGFAQLLERLRPKGSYAAGFTATKRTGSARVAQYKCPMTNTKSCLV